MKRTLVLTTALVGSLAVPAYAGSADAGYVEPAPMTPVAPVVPVNTTDWTGFSVGGQIGYGDVETDGAGGVDGGDALYGLRAYYDYDFGGYVLGGGLQYDETDIDLDNAATVDSVLRLGGRVGGKYQSTMFYGTGGYAKAFTEDDAVSLGDSNGYFVGLGAESMIADNLSVGTEVLYHKFEDFDINGVEADATTANVFVNYRF